MQSMTRPLFLNIYNIIYSSLSNFSCYRLFLTVQLARYFRFLDFYLMTVDCLGLLSDNQLTYGDIREEI